MVGHRLREIRQGARLMQKDSRQPAISVSKLSRLERGLHRVRVEDTVQLVEHYNVGMAEAEQLVQLTKLANEPGWWAPFRRIVPSWFDRFIGLQEAATWTRTYEYQLVPGLLQTEEYARAVTEVKYLLEGEVEVEARVRLRMERQELLCSPARPRLLAILHEAVLHNHFGGPEVMRRQVEHLIDMAAMPNITIRVMPFTNRCLALGSPMTLLRFDQYQLPDLAYIERGSRSEYIGDLDETDFFSAQMAQLVVHSASVEESLAMLKSAL
ncbi:helix-turn-helix domain-containing protein [Streptomyces sp. NPDC060031]|uniref:helix-turn-helix domain-containing protein n=1 Tax=Streptomyces sp. NPDC060031 TaxID=3347043 RepID=UPI00368878B2